MTTNVGKQATALVSPGDINERLRRIRELEGLSISDFWRRVQASGYSRQSVANYEFHDPKRPEDSRMPPADYVAHVATEFQYDVRWILTGEGPERPEASEEARSFIQDRRFEEGLFPDAARYIGAVPWMDNVYLRMALFRLLDEAKTSLRRDPEYDSDKAEREVLQFLGALQPTGAYFLRFQDLPKRRQAQAWMHVQGLMYLLFRPFHEEEQSFSWSQALRRANDDDPPPSQEDVDA